MEDGKWSFKIRIAQVGIERRILKSNERYRVNECPALQRIEIRSVGIGGFAFLAKMKQKEFEIRSFRLGSEEALLDCGQRFERPGTRNAGIGRDRTPSQTLQATLLCLRFYGTARRLFLTRRQEDHSESEHRRQLDAGLSRLLANQFVRDASEQTGAVTAPAVGVHTSAMRQPDQSFERAIYDLARRDSADLGDQADTAGVVVCG